MVVWFEVGLNWCDCLFVVYCLFVGVICWWFYESVVWFVGYVVFDLICFYVVVLYGELFWVFFICKIFVVDVWRVGLLNI